MSGWIIGAAALLVFVGVLWLRQRLASPPFVRLGADLVADDDPIMNSALARARETRGEFLQLFAANRDHCMVKFRFGTDAGETEELWAGVRSIDDGVVSCVVLTPPQTHQGEFEPAMSVPLDEIRDWSVELQDGTLRGGFTNLAMLRIYERDHGPLPKHYAQQRARFVDA